MHNGIASATSHTHQPVDADGVVIVGAAATTERLSKYTYKKEIFDDQAKIIKQNDDGRIQIPMQQCTDYVIGQDVIDWEHGE